MIELLAVSLVVALVCNGLIIATTNGYLLYPVRQALEYFLVKTHEVILEQGIDAHELFEVKRELPEPKIHWLYKPLLACASCMPSIYGTAIYFIHFGVTPEIWYQLPIVLFSSVSISTIINQQFV